MPIVEQLWHVLTETLRATFTMMLNELDPTAPILLLATSECHYSTLDDHVTISVKMTIMYFRTKA